MSGSEFYDTESVCLARIAAGIGVPLAQVEEVVQEAWWDAVKHRHLFSAAAGKGCLCSWLRRVVRSKAVDVIRHLKRCRCESLDAIAIELIDGAAAKHAETAEQGERLNALLEKACGGNEESRRLLCEHYLQERSIKELAYEFGMTEDAVDCRIRRLLRKLRRLTEGDARGRESDP